jgi:antibiotic biosynthesis monooxygenase (ABM) superfamily enzyme
VIGGLACGTVSTLMFVPVVFAIVHGWLARRKAKVAAQEATLDQPADAEQ